VNGNVLDSSPRPPVVDTSRSPYARLRPLPLDAVNLADDFWEPRRRINREVMLPSQYRHLEDADFSVHFEPELLGGVVLLMAEARAAAPDDGWEDRFYRTVHPREGEKHTHATRITAVPYYAWANREPGAMRVWLRNG
jgi:hypothetical protein